MLNVSIVYFQIKKMAMIAGVHYMKSLNTIGTGAKILNGILNTKVRRKDE